MTGETPAGVGVDGCGAPVYATSLVALARGFGRLATARIGSSEHLVADAMRDHPEMVGGTGVDDTRLMRRSTACWSRVEPTACTVPPYPTDAASP